MREVKVKVDRVTKLTHLLSIHRYWMVQWKSDGIFVPFERDFIGMHFKNYCDMSAGLCVCVLRSVCMCVCLCVCVCVYLCVCVFVVIYGVVISRRQHFVI